MPQIMPITELRNTTNISKLCNESVDPIFITKNGYGDLVVMSTAVYERDLVMADVFKKLAVAEREIENEELVDAKDVFDGIAAAHGLNF